MTEQETIDAVARKLTDKPFYTTEYIGDSRWCVVVYKQWGRDGPAMGLAGRYDSFDEAMDIADRLNDTF
jgi:hypothetical protein